LTEQKILNQEQILDRHNLHSQYLQVLNLTEQQILKQILHRYNLHSRYHEILKLTEQKILNL
jgi:hypothetical protein